MALTENRATAGSNAGHHKLESLDDLKPAPYNPRKISKSAASGLSASLERFGDLSGIVWNRRTGHLVAGHQRVNELRGLGAQLVRGGLEIAVHGEVRRFPVRVVDMDDGEEHAANVVANNPLISGEFTDTLSDVLNIAKASIGDDVFKDLALDGLMARASAAFVNLAEVDRGDAEQIVSPGDTWQMGNHILHCGDSSDFAPGHFDSLVWDPPWDKHFVPPSGRTALAFCDGMRLGDVVKAFGAPTWLFVWDCVSSWYTPNRPLRRGKMCAWFGDIDQYDFDGSHYGDPGEAKQVTNTRGSYSYIPDARGKHLADVFQAPITSLHSAEGAHSHGKPLEWVRMLVANCTNGIVYDPFAGGGSTIVACEQLGRKCIAVEIDPRNCDAIIMRWSSMTGESPKRA